MTLPPPKDQSIHAPFLKWAGGKRWLVRKLLQIVPRETSTLIEPFVGSGAFFLNFNYKEAHLSDINHDLINLYQWIKKSSVKLVKKTREYFLPKNNSAAVYYALRKKFNESSPFSLEKAALFVYLNRHGYNGLCRYNRSGGFNVPFGSYSCPYFPEKEIYFFSKKAKQAFFYCESFEDAFQRAAEIKTESNTLSLYCDPPYLPLNQSTYFAGYSPKPFYYEHHLLLADRAKQFAQNNYGSVFISNHSTPESLALYQNAFSVEKLSAPRKISSKVISRKPCQEILVHYKAGCFLKQAAISSIQCLSVSDKI